MIENEYVLFMIEKECNSKCDICILEGADGPLIDLFTIPFAYFKKILDSLPDGQFSGVKFCGGEPTLNEALPEYAAYAKKKGFSNIMVMTNARALSNIHKAEELKSAGINQFFVSFHSADYDLSDNITGRRGAHNQTVKGLENLQKLNLPVITNTVISSVNYTVLLETAQFLQNFSNITELQFWGYYPMSVKASELVLPYALAAPYLNKTINYLVSQGKELCVKSFPVCLLEDCYRKYHNNAQPERCFGFKKNFDERIMSCEFKTYSCCNGTDCMGLPEVYRKAMLGKGWMPSLAD